jgi:hypothetical protein
MATYDFCARACFIRRANGFPFPLDNWPRRLMRPRSGGASFEQYMTREELSRANDELRQHFRDGRIEVSHGPYEIDDRTMGRMLCAIAKYDSFSADSQHDEGVLVFAGFSVAWDIRADSGELWRTASDLYFRVDKILRELENPNLHDIANMSYRVQLRDQHADHIRWAVAAAGNVIIGHAAFDAAVAEWPDPHFTLCNGMQLLREHPKR